MFNIVTVVFHEELDILKLQAQSIELYCQDLDIDEITVIINDDTMDRSQIDPSWWGSLQHLVRIIPRKTWNNQWHNNGWLTQQILKLFGSTGSSKWNLILDAKTIFTQLISHTNLVRDEQFCTGQLDIQPVFEPSRQIVEKLFNIKLDKQLGPGGVPFVMQSLQVQSMITWIEEHTGQSFVDWFQTQGMVTEFILYSGWLVKNFGHLDAVGNKTNSLGLICNICHSEVGRADQKLNEMQRATAVSIHRNAWKNFNQQQKETYKLFLIKQGISRAEEVL